MATTNDSDLQCVTTLNVINHIIKLTGRQDNDDDGDGDDMMMI